MPDSSVVLVTGATGFVGSTLVDVLKVHGVAVRPVSRRSLADLNASPISSFNASTDWSKVLKGCSMVVHLAARVHVMQDPAADPLAAFRAVNVEGTLNLACQAAAAGVKRFVFMSSIKVNGEQTPIGHPFTPNDAPNPVDPYGISKYEAEQGLRLICEQTGMALVIIRPVLVYGPGVKGNFLSLIRWLDKGIPLPLGAIDNARSLVALGNLVDLIVTCLYHPAAANQTFLVSDGEDISTPELLKRTAAALGIRPRLIPVPVSIIQMGATLLGKRNMAHRLCSSLQVDISKTRDLLGWRPPLSVDEGLCRATQGFCT